MISKPPQIEVDDKSPTALRKDFHYILVISSNGKDFDVCVPEWLVPLINPELIKKVKEIANDVFYQLRPDLRPQ